MSAIQIENKLHLGCKSTSLRATIYCLMQKYIVLSGYFYQCMWACRFLTAVIKVKSMKYIRGKYDLYT